VKLHKDFPSKRHEFVAIIYKVGILRCVSVPEAVCAQLTSGRAVPVVITVAGRTARTTLLPAARGGFRLYLDGAMRKAAGADAGDPVGIALRLDRASREMPVPSDLAGALARVPAAQREYRAATTALRREILRYIEKAKAPSTRARRLAHCVHMLTGRARKKRQQGR
jgi:bacteriocin resistance YdeI/OmpD-like protein/uncharacterized protein DUF1905